MKQIKLLYIFLTLGCVSLFYSCEDDKIGKTANIELTFTVENTVANEKGDLVKHNLNSVIKQDSIIIKIAPHLDQDLILNGATPTFYLSKGATVTPDPKEPQNFAQEGGVKYTVTSEDGKHVHDYIVTWGPSDILPHGEGFTYAEVGAAKDFVNLGYPGEVGNWYIDGILLGDLSVYHAYCGNNIVLLSRAYVEKDPSSPHALKVVDKTSLNPAGTLNLGTISITNLKMITSDYKGRCVGVVTNGNETELFYWTNPSDVPTSIGKVAVNLAPAADVSNNFQVAGDITANAWITALAPRGAKGEHYRIQVTDGKLASNYSIIETGFSSSDCSGFQMISPLDDSDKPNFAIGDTEGTVGGHSSNHAYVNTFSGLTTATMPPLWQSTLQSWWVGTGFSTNRYGGRSPVVSALPINGKPYVIVTSGTGWWHAAAVLESNLQTLAHNNLNIAFGSNRAWSAGAWVDWYWDEDKKEAYLAVWFGRLGLYTYKMSCYE